MSKSRSRAFRLVILASAGILAVCHEVGTPPDFDPEVAMAGERSRVTKGTPGYISKIAAPNNVVLEIARHEEQERKALEGELWVLARAWEQAEEITAISDHLLLPDGAGDFLEEPRFGEDQI